MESKYLTQREAMQITELAWAENEGLKEACDAIRKAAEKGVNKVDLHLSEITSHYLTEYLGYVIFQKNQDGSVTVEW